MGGNLGIRGGSMTYDSATPGGTRAAFQVASQYYTQSRSGVATVLPL